MKKIGKKIVVKILKWQVKRLVNKNKFKIVGVAGSIGKTSTKLAIAKMLSISKRVQYQDGNYNDAVTVPLIFFGHNNPPSLMNPFAWMKLLLANEKIIKSIYPYDVVVVELGTDGKGQIADFGTYLKLDIGVLTAISYEHMKFFKDLDDVANEELAISQFSKVLFANKDMCGNYLNDKNVLTYGMKNANFSLGGSNGMVNLMVNNKSVANLKTQGFADSHSYSLLAGAAVGHELGLTPDQLQSGSQLIKPAPGRMQILHGKQGSIIYDDSYNSSPEAAKASLLALYEAKTTNRIALLGNMNELGKFSETEHKKLGQLCDPAKLSLVVTLGIDANKFTALEAEKQGCNVLRSNSPEEAGQIILDALKPGATVLVKGSQNGVFAEEAIKLILENPSDAQKLVRQTNDWLKIKRAQFNNVEA